MFNVFLFGEWWYEFRLHVSQWCSSSVADVGCNVGVSVSAVLVVMVM